MYYSAVAAGRVRRVRACGVRACVCVNMPARTHVVAALTREINITLFNIFATSCT